LEPKKDDNVIYIIIRNIHDNHLSNLFYKNYNFYFRINEQWIRLGPANKRCYDVLPMQEKAILKPASVDLVRSCVNFLSSGEA